MIVKCKSRSCAMVYDDAMQSTLCPHDPFIDAPTARRKDEAQRMLFSGKRYRFKYETGGKGHRLLSVSWDGLITVEGFEAEYRPDQLKEVED